MSRFIRLAVITLSIAVLGTAQDRADLEAIYKIKQETLQNSKVMDHMFYLTDVNGPRLTGSANYRKAAEWVVKTLQEWGLKNARIEKAGSFGKSWENERFSAHMLAPSYQPLYGFPMAWTPSTEGVVAGEPIVASVTSDADIAKWKGQLKGKIVLSESPRELQPYDKPLFSRYTAEQLAGLGDAPEPGQPMFRMPSPTAGPRMTMQERMALRKKITAFWAEEAPAVVIQYGYRGDGGTMAGAAGGSRDPKDPIAPPMIIITPEHYNRIYRLVDKKIPVKLEIEIRNKMGKESEDLLNVVADLPGTGSHKDEVVMIGGHLDSWHGGTGATDNAAGSAVMMEVVRVLTKLNLKLDRTVRIGLWGGEEQGLLGSREYVKEVFADRETMKTTAQWEKLSAYYNIDNGTGKVRGIYLQGNEMARPIFEAWLAPFRDLGVTTVSIRNTGGTDHQSFDAVGLPGFQFIQDPIEYSTRTHHSNMDVYDRIQKGDVMQISAIVASMVYHTANRPEKLPRKPKPEPGAGRSRMPVSE